MVVHCFIPEWSVDRGIPAWSVAWIRDADFRRVPCLGAAVTDVMSAGRLREGWLSGQPPWRPTPWTDDAIASVARFFDAPFRSASGAGGPYRFPVPALDAGGWIALQALLVAMRDLGLTESPTAVIAREPGWAMPPGATMPSLAYLFEDALSDPASLAPVPQPSSRGVALREFVRDFPALHEVLVRIVRSSNSARASDPSIAEPHSFIDFLSSSDIVPLERLEPLRLERDEWVPWAACMASSEGGPDVATLLDRLAVRVRGGESALVGPMLALASEWSQRNAGAPDLVRRRLDAWLAPPTDRSRPG